LYYASYLNLTISMALVFCFFLGLLSIASAFRFILLSVIYKGTTRLFHSVQAYVCSLDSCWSIINQFSYEFVLEIA